MREVRSRSCNCRGFVCWWPPTMRPRPVGCWPPPKTVPDRSAARFASAAWILDHDTDSYQKISRAIFRAPRSWVEQGYPTLTYFHKADRGGHFAAWEEPQLFADEIRAAFRSLR